MSTWSIPLSAMAEQAKLDLETVARKVTLQLFSAVVQRSPVGNADTWKSNSHRVFARENFNALAELQNARAADNPRNFTRRGAIRKGVLVKTKTASALRKAFPNAAGRGYVGGRFRANWIATAGAIDKWTTTSTSQAQGAAEAARGATLPLGGVIYFTNSLPYAVRLENGWSKQAPAGMVKLTVAEFDRFVKASIR